jgi:hypothetical protein
MKLNLNPSFSLVGWSLSTFIIFIIIQATVSVSYGAWGHSLSPFVGFFTWAAVSGALVYAIRSKYKTEPLDFLFLQLMACFYMLAVSMALIFRSGAEAGFGGLFGSLLVMAVFLGSGLLGTWAASTYHDWRHRP